MEPEQTLALGSRQNNFLLLGRITMDLKCQDWEQSVGPDPTIGASVELALLRDCYPSAYDNIIARGK